MHFREEVVCRVEPITAYAHNAVLSGRVFTLSTGVHFAFPDTGPDGSLKNTYRILERVSFQCAEYTDYIYVCDCPESYVQTSRIKETNTAHFKCRNALRDFISHEKMVSCIHSKALEKIGLKTLCLPDDYPKAAIPAENGEPIIDQLSATPLSVAICDYRGEFGIVSLKRKKLRCTACREYECYHITVYKAWMQKEGLTDEFLTQSTDKEVSYDSVTSTKLPYPFTEKMRQCFFEYECGVRQLPTNLVPDVPSHTCPCGNKFDTSDPVSKNWLLPKKGMIRKKFFSTECQVYYRPTLNTPCQCRYYYQGDDDLLFNVDNVNVFYVPYLFDYLHDSYEARVPLQAHFRSSKRTVQILSPSNDHVIPYHVMHKAFNSFIRKIDFKFQDIFHCPECDQNNDGPDTVIMDGICMGCRKDLTPNFINKDIPTPLIPEVPLRDRVLINDYQTRNMLREYCGWVKGSLSNDNAPLNATKFKVLLNSLSCLPSLQTLIKSFGPKCPEKARLFLSQFGIGSPSASILQVPPGSDTEKNILLVAKGKTDLYDPQNAQVHDDIKTNAHIIFAFLKYCHSEKIEMLEFVNDVIVSKNKPFSFQTPTEDRYSPITESQNFFHCFPRYPVLRGPGKYKADRYKSDKHGCRKLTQSHHTLTPGLFVISCVHGITLGFKFMQDVESPKTAFDVLMSHFKKMPKNVIYDNCCQLCTYSLKREPSRFKNTRWLVDRFHFNKNHIGCSRGFCMDEYSDLSKVNSEIREQENSLLRRLATQITYMRPENAICHIKVFLAIRNMDLSAK